MRFLLKMLLPDQEDFFKLFSNTAEKVVAVAHEFEALLKHLDRPDAHAKAIETHEQAAHHLTNMTLEKLHKTFITPFDRYDIHRFVKKLDDAVDSIHRTMQRVTIYQLTSVPQEINALATLGVKCAEVIQSATNQLHSMKNANKILELCDIVSRLESQSEQLLLSGVSHLFQKESDIRTLLKIKEIYEYSKANINGFQTVANIIKDIVLEYS